MNILGWIMVVVLLLLYIFYLCIRSVQNTSRPLHILKSNLESFSYFRLKPRYEFVYRTLHESTFKDADKEVIKRDLVQHRTKRISELVSMILMNQSEYKRQTKQLSELMYIGETERQYGSWVPQQLYSYIESHLINQLLNKPRIITPEIIVIIQFKPSSSKKTLAKEFSFSVDELHTALKDKKSTIH